MSAHRSHAGGAAGHSSCENAASVDTENGMHSTMDAGGQGPPNHHNLRRHPYSITKFLRVITGLLLNIALAIAIGFDKDMKSATLTGVIFTCSPLRKPQKTKMVTHECYSMLMRRYTVYKPLYSISRTHTSI